MNNKKINIISLKVCKEKSVEYSFERIIKPNDILKLVKTAVGDTDREYFMVINLNNQNLPNSIEITSIGSLTETMVSPREVFKSAIVSNSARIILCHTHPSGSTSPSDADIKITNALVKIGEFLDIPVIDHLIVGGDSVYSLMENGDIKR